MIHRDCILLHYNIGHINVWISAETGMPSGGTETTRTSEGNNAIRQCKAMQTARSTVPRPLFGMCIDSAPTTLWYSFCWLEHIYWWKLYRTYQFITSLHHDMCSTCNILTSIFKYHNGVGAESMHMPNNGLGTVVVYIYI